MVLVVGDHGLALATKSPGTPLHAARVQAIYHRSANLLILFHAVQQLLATISREGVHAATARLPGVNGKDGRSAAPEGGWRRRAPSPSRRAPAEIYCGW